MVIIYGTRDNHARLEFFNCWQVFRLQFLLFARCNSFNNSDTEIQKIDFFVYVNYKQWFNWPQMQMGHKN